jgi:hypothetical protein
MSGGAETATRSVVPIEDLLQAIALHLRLLGYGAELVD